MNSTPQKSAILESFSASSTAQSGHPCSLKVRMCEIGDIFLIILRCGSRGRHCGG
jgi:hypothetical protein